MVIDAGEPQILVRLGAQRVEQPLAAVAGVDLAAGDLLEQRLELFV